MLVSGVRSSCEASARKRRSFSSVAARSANASSMRPSIVFRLRPSRPTSVRGSAGCTRRVRSPAAMASAVTAIVSSGRRSRLISHQAAAARAPSTSSDTTTSMVSSRVNVCRVSASGMATTSTLSRFGTPSTSTRNPADWPPAVESAENTTLRSPLAGDRQRVGEHGRRLILLAVGELDGVEDVAGAVTHLPVRPGGEVGVTRARPAREAGLVVGQGHRDGHARVAELRVYALEQEPAQGEVGDEAGHEQAGGHARQHGEEQTGAEAHAAAVIPSAAGPCGPAAAQ